MFQAPRPISHAPTQTYFTPAATVNVLTPFQQQQQHNKQERQQDQQQQQQQTNATTASSPSLVSPRAHTVAVPLSLSGSSTHRPIAISAPRGSVSGIGGGTRNFASRIQTADPTLTYSPSASPSLHSTSVSPAVQAIQTSATPSAGGVGFSLSTPSPPLPQANIDPPLPSSPSLSAYSFGVDRDRRDSFDENEAASAHLQGILWRNAAALRAAALTRHPQTPLINSHALASPSRANMSPLAGPMTPTAYPPATPPGQTSSFSRAIPIARRSGASMPLHLSILGQMQHGAGGGDEPLGTSQAHAYANASREGSRRGSGSQSFGPPAIHGGSSPLTGTSLGSSYILSQTPPVRAGNPIDRDSYFNPAQQAEWLLRQHGSDYSMLPMVASTSSPILQPHQPSVPILQSTLSLSLAARQSAQKSGPSTFHKFGSPLLHSMAIPKDPAPITHVEGRDENDDIMQYPKLSCTL